MRFFRRAKIKQVLVLGLDCASPNLIFEEFWDELPTLRSLMQQGTWGELTSSIPCITIPAWSSMLSSRDPGVLGIYGFRNRSNYDYDDLTIANSKAVKVKRVWDYLGVAEKSSLVLNVPQTYPPRPIRGHLASGFLTPGSSSTFTYPAIFKQEILNLVPEYTFDVKDFRTTEKDSLLKSIIDLTNIQYGVLLHMLNNHSWDFAMHVNIGVDRLHHGFWRYHDPKHRFHEPKNPYRNVIREYYMQVDHWIGRILERVDDDVIVLIVSDHGVKRMDGAICINEWLWQNRWLALKNPPAQGEITPIEKLEIDWARTKAWSTGGYYGRIFLNVVGREPQGIIPEEDYLPTLAELADQLQRIPDASGDRLHTQVFQPGDIYQQVNGIAPDLMVYFGDLHWRTVGSMGYGQHYTLENDTGSDDANHASEGMFILHEPGKGGRGTVTGHQLMDIAPTILHRMNIGIPQEMQGQTIT